MATTAVYPGSFNTFIPDFETSGKLQVEYSRNVNDFPLNKYVGFKTTQKPIGYYLQITGAEAARIVTQQDYFWPDGQNAPDDHAGTESFKFPLFECARYAFGWTLGQMAVDNANFEVVAAHARIHAQKAMTARTQRVITALTTSGNWPAANTATGTTAGGGAWATSSNTNQYILKSFLYAQNAIHKTSLGAVRPDKLTCVISPELAQVIRYNSEITDYIKQNNTALNTLAGNSFFERWGIPPRLYGVRMVVEDTVQVSTRKGQTVSPSHAFPNNKAVFLYTPDGLESGIEPADSAPTFNTVTLFVAKGMDMAVETMNDPNNKLVRGRVIDMTAEVLTAPASGFLLTEC